MKTTLFFALLLIGQAVYTQENKITFYPDSAKDIISRHIYGHFSEHLGRCIYGGFWVDKDSGIPNTGRIRNDVVAALKEIAIPNLRWPGGCFADEYHWMNGIGPEEDRPSMINTNWGGVTEDNSFGTHEFMRLCQMLDCEPVVCGNVGSGTVREMSEWVEYLNSDNISPMTNLRKENGREESFGVRYFGIGNESWGCGGNMTAEYYSDVLRRYSSFCKNYGKNRLYKIASGPSDSNYHWTETLMKDWQTRQMFQGLSLHYYTRAHTESWSYKGSATDFTTGEWFSTMSNALRIDTFINRHSKIMDRYDPGKEIGLIVDEWGNWHDIEPGTNPGFLFQQNTLRDAVSAAVSLDIFNNHCDRVKMANIAQVINVLQSVLLTRDNDLVKTPTFYVFKMYKVHHDALLIPNSTQSVNYTEGGRSVAAVHSSCSRDDDGRYHITITNLDPDNALDVDCEFKGLKKMNVTKGEIITAGQMNALNDFGKEEEV
ncbi:MAG TPA: alpha-L-arabinofuranosidase C-terminal domain-containing protein, partial [Bacteroidales bacterium]|nr:alpha-L-arabinofuranosidase C-terminal domain-containing protein [Bacteroidales bacterium]